MQPASFHRIRKRHNNGFHPFSKMFPRAFSIFHVSFSSRLMWFVSSRLCVRLDFLWQVFLPHIWVLQQEWWYLLSSLVIPGYMNCGSICRKLTNGFHLGGTVALLKHVRWRVMLLHWSFACRGVCSLSVRSYWTEIYCSTFCCCVEVAWNEFACGCFK